MQTASISASFFLHYRIEGGGSGFSLPSFFRTTPLVRFLIPVGPTITPLLLRSHNYIMDVKINVTVNNSANQRWSNIRLLYIIIAYTKLYWSSLGFT